MSSHIDASGKAVMVDVSAKGETDRRAAAEGRIRVSPAVIRAIRDNTVKKGDVLAVARVAGIMAVKNAPGIIPLCHTLPVGGCAVDFEVADDAVRVLCAVSCRARTGAEMEALCGVAAALLTIYDMCKAIDKGMEIDGVRLLSKTGGKSGDWRRDESGG